MAALPVPAYTGEGPKHREVRQPTSGHIAAKWHSADRLQSLCPRKSDEPERGAQPAKDSPEPLCDGGGIIRRTLQGLPAPTPLASPGGPSEGGVLCKKVPGSYKHWLSPP